MKSPQKTSAGRRGRVILIAPLTLALAFCAGRVIRTTADDPARIPVDQLWVEPADLESRDLFHGAGGPDLAPDPAVPYALVAVDNSGYSKGYDVKDPEGTEWSVKLGIEAQPEVVASRVLWAIGYHQPPTYVLTQWEMTGHGGGAQQIGRFRREPSNQTTVADWSWYENPFVTTQPFKGLVVANLILNNWDWKTSNNKIYDITNSDGTGRRVYIVRDLGAALGKTSFPKLLRWIPMRGFGQGSRNDLADFEEQGFVKGVEGQKVKFDYRGIHQTLVDAVTVEDVLWTCRLLARLSDQQLREAFRAAGYSDEHQQRFAAKLKSKIQEGLALVTPVSAGQNVRLER